MPDEASILKGHIERMDRITAGINRNSMLEFRPLTKSSLRRLKKIEKPGMLGCEIRSPRDKLMMQVMRPDIEIR